MKTFYIFSIALFTLLSSCKTDFAGKVKADYSGQDNNANGSITRKVNDIVITVNPIHSKYVAYDTHIEQNPAIESSAKSSGLEKDLLTFVMTISPNKEKTTVSVAEQNIENYQGYEERLMTMNFGMQRYVMLYVDSVMYTPICATVENLYELSSSRKVIISFPIYKSAMAKSNNKEYIFIYKDPFFKIGTLQFPFNKDALVKDI